MTGHDPDLVKAIAAVLAETGIARMDLGGVPLVAVDPPITATVVLDALEALGLYPSRDARRSPVAAQDDPARTESRPDQEQATTGHGPTRTIANERVMEVRVLLDADRATADVIDVIERALCPHPDEPGHADICPLLIASSGPLVPDPDGFDRDPAALAWARAKVEHVIAGVNRLRSLVGQTRTPTDAALLVRYVDWLRRDFQHGGLDLAAFDPRLPDVLAKDGR